VGYGATKKGASLDNFTSFNALDGPRRQQRCKVAKGGTFFLFSAVIRRAAGTVNTIIYGSILLVVLLLICHLWPKLNGQRVPTTAP
jgi:hypothetical protein